MTQPNRSTDVVVIGGGVAGLAAARQLVSQGHSVVLLEEQESLGGRAKTVTIDGVGVDLGAAFISDFYKETMRLVKELGIESRLAKRSQTAYIIRESHPQPIWPAPKLVENRALSLLGKLRLTGLFPTLMRHWQNLDISDLAKIEYADRATAAEYARQTLGAEDTEFFFAPLLRGLLYWDPETTSAAVVWCILKAFMTSKTTYRFDNGMSDLVDSLASNVEVVLHASANRITGTSDGGFTVQASKDGVNLAFSCKAVLCAAPAPIAVRLADNLPRELREFLESVSYSRTTMLTYRVKTDASTYPRGAYLFPASSVSDLTSINPLYNYIDQEQAEMNDRSLRLLNVYLSDKGARDYENLCDPELGATVLKRMAEVLGHPRWIQDAEVAHVHRWELAIPRFNVGHIKAVQEFIERQTLLTPGLVFAGDYIGGPYVDGAIRSGIKAAWSLNETILRGSRP